MGLLKILFVLNLLFFPFGQIARFQLGNGLSILLNDVATLCLFFTWIFYLIFSKKKPFGKLFLPIVIFIGIAIISLFVNIKLLKLQEFFVAGLYILRFAAYSGLYFIVKEFDYKFKKIIIGLMIITGGIIVFSGYIQYFLYASLRNLYYLGWDEHMHRMFSSFLDPNFAGVFFVLYSLFLVGLIFKYRETKKNNKVKLSLIIFLLIPTVLGVFLTYSRSALIALFFSLFAFLIIRNTKKLMVVVILLFLIFFAISSQNFYIENVNLLRIVSSEARVKSALEAINIIKRNPILGVGFNAYRYAQIRYGTRTGQNVLISHADAGTDNSFLFVLATTGVFGFIAYLFLWFKVLKLSFVKIKQNTEWLRAIIFASAVGLFIDSLFINSLFYPSIMMWMWLLLGLKEEKT